MTTQQQPTEDWLDDDAPVGEGDLDAEINRLDDDAGEATAAALEDDDTPEGDEAPEPQETPEPAPAPDEVTRLRQEHAQLSQYAQQRQQQEYQAGLQRAAAQYAQQRIQELVNQGYDEHTARQMGVLEAREQLAAHRTQAVALQGTMMELNYRYGIPIEHLQNFTDVRQMLTYAQQYATTTGPQASRVAQLEKEIAQLKRGRVPAQNYNRPGGGGSASSEERLLDQYNAGVRTPQTEAAAKRAAGF